MADSRNDGEHSTAATKEAKPYFGNWAAACLMAVVICWQKGSTLLPDVFA